jgi:uncharacterized protein
VDAAATEVAVEGWKQKAYTLDSAVPALDEEAATLLSPFDSLIWTRPRQARLFGKDYRLEAYKPAAAREFGYFAMPVLRGHRICGRMALRRADGLVQVENEEWDRGVPKSVARRSVEQVARWVDSRSVRAEETAK